MITQDLAIAAPELFLAIAAMALMMLGVFRGENSTNLVSGVATLALILAAGLVLVSGSETRIAFGGLFVVDGFARLMKLLVLVGTALTLIMSGGYNQREDMARFEYPVLFVMAALGMLMMISANDLISLYLGLELQSLSLYVIAAFRRDSLRSSEAGLKYFVLGALSSGLLLYGSSLIYGFTGTTSFDGLATAFSGGAPVSIGIIIGIVFVCAALAFKVSAAPFHMWTPDVYEGAPTPVTAFFSVAPKIAAIALFVRVLIGPFGDLVQQWQQIVVAISLLSMGLGAFAAIAQPNIKRLMAYSSIGHVGYALMGLAAGTPEGVRGIALYLIVYLAMNVGTFVVILSMRIRGRMVEQISDLKGLSRTNPTLALAMAIFMFSMAGIPPLAGFFGKLYVFLAAVEAGLYWLAILGVLASTVAAFYYIRIIKVMYFDEPTEALDQPLAPDMRAILLVSAVFTALFWILPGPFVTAAEAAARTLFG